MLRSLDKLNREKLYWYYLGLFLVAFIALLPLTMLWHPLKYDMIDQYYPWRYFVGECLQEGILPLWNPYQILGEPIHANPQSAAWYPITWFFGYFFGYDIYIISYDYFLHIFLAGMGMFFLGRQLKFRNETAFMMAAAYMLSGLFVGNAQHMTYIVSGTWIPFTIGAFIRLREKQTLARAVGLALILFLFISGGYPSFMFVLLYLLIAIFLFYAIGYIRQKDFRSLLRYSGFLALAGVIMVLMSSVVLVSVYHLKDAMTRGVGVTLEEALFGAFTPQCMISFILPFAVIRNMEFFNTDLSMSNGYFGVIPLVFFFLALMLRRPKIINVFLAWGTFTLLAALGESLPVREFLYRYIPFMDQFRFPAAFRVYVILSFLVVAGFGFDNWLKGDYSLSKKLRWIVIGMAIIILGFAIAQIFRRQLDLLTFIRHEAFIFSNKSTVAQHIFFQSVIQLILLSSLYFILTEKSVIKNLPLIVIILVSADMAIATRLNGPYSIYSHIYKSKDIYRHSREHFRDGFPVPGNGLIIENRDSKLGYQTFWRNLNIFHKKVSHQGYNPMQLKGYVELADNHPRLFEAILQNRLFYQTATISSLDSLPVHEAAGIYDPTRVYFNDEDYQELKDYVSSTSPGDTVFLTGFSPLEMTIRSKSEGPVLVNLLQSYYHGWRAKVDEEPVKIYMANFGLMSVVVPAGEHEVIFGYRPVDVRIAFYVSLVVFLMGLMLLRGTL